MARFLRLCAAALRSAPRRPFAAVPCWQCPVTPKADSLFCSGCDSLQEPTKQNYFELLELPPAFAVDRPALDRQCRALQRKLHPDRFGTRPVREQLLSASHAARANEACATLRDPLARARYLLRLCRAEGVEGVQDEDILLSSEVDPQLLMEVLETREDIADAVGDQPRLVALHAENRAKFDHEVKCLTEAFADVGAFPPQAGDGTTPPRDADALARATAAAARLSYWHTIDLEIVRHLDELPDTVVNRS